MKRYNKNGECESRGGLLESVKTRREGEEKMKKEKEIRLSVR